VIQEMSSTAFDNISPEVQAAALLPDSIRWRGQWTEFGEYSWRSCHLDEVFEAAIVAGIACIDGWIDLESRDGVLRLRDVCHGPSQPMAKELWTDFLNRSTLEAQAAIRSIVNDERLLEHIRSAGLPVDWWELDNNPDGLGVWFVLRFVANEAV